MSPEEYKSEIGDVELLSEFDKISIYVDSSCLENQNVSKSTPAAWAVLL